MDHHKPIKLAFLTTDVSGQFSPQKESPVFGTSHTSLLAGFSNFPELISVDVIYCSKSRPFFDTTPYSNIRIHQVHVNSLDWGRSLFLGCALKVRNLLTSLDIDLVHAQGTERDCGVSMMMAPRLPKLLTIHGHMARIAEILNAKPLSYYWLVKHLEALAIRRADGVVAITRYTQQRLGERARQTWVVPNAVDPSFFEVNAAGTGDVVLCVASLSPWKRQVELIQAFDRIPENQRPRLVLLGVGAESGYGEDVMRLVNERPWCEHPGAVGREELKDWLRKAGLVILPSTEDNCPMVVLEAMAAGVPVAASRIGGIPDLIDHGVNGQMFDPQDIGSIRDALLRWRNDPAEAAAMAETAKRRALERFHPKAIASEHLRIYQEVLSKRRA